MVLVHHLDVFVTIRGSLSIVQCKSYHSPFVNGIAPGGESVQIQFASVIPDITGSAANLHIPSLGYQIVSTIVHRMVFARMEHVYVIKDTWAMTVIP